MKGIFLMLLALVTTVFCAAQGADGETYNVIFPDGDEQVVYDRSSVDGVNSAEITYNNRDMTATAVIVGPEGKPSELSTASRKM